MDPTKNYVRTVLASVPWRVYGSHTSGCVAAEAQLRLI